MQKLIVFLGVVFTAAIALAHYPTTTKVDAAMKKQPAVPFNHAKHGDTLVKRCDTCHHTEKGLTKAQIDKVDVKKCSECHLEAKGKVPSMRDPDRKSTRLNSSHGYISYAVFCLKKKKKNK